MTGGLLALARSGVTYQPLLVDILDAKAVNAALGGALVGPWDVGEIDEATIEACKALTFELPDLRRAVAQTEDKFARWRADHPTYRK